MPAALQSQVGAAGNKQHGNGTDQVRQSRQKADVQHVGNARLLNDGGRPVVQDRAANGYRGPACSNHIDARITQSGHQAARSVLRLLAVLFFQGVQDDELFLIGQPLRILWFVGQVEPSHNARDHGRQAF